MYNPSQTGLAPQPQSIAHKRRNQPLLRQRPKRLEALPPPEPFQANRSGQLSNTVHQALVRQTQIRRVQAREKTRVANNREPDGPEPWHYYQV